MGDMRVGRDVGERLAKRIAGGIKLGSGERCIAIVRLHGKRPPADSLVFTNARVMSIASQLEPLRWVQRQVLADEIGTWRLSRMFRSRLTVTSGYHRTHVFGTSISTLDDDLVDDSVTTLVTGAADRDNVAAIRALRAKAHWITGVHGKAVYVLDRSLVPSTTASDLDLDMVENQLSQFEHWPNSEMRRHLAVCLPAGGCFLALRRDDDPPGVDDIRRAEEVADAVVTVDPAKLRRSAPRESDVLQKLLSVAAHIRASPVWQTSYLDANDVRIDMNAEVRDVALRCNRAGELRSEIGEPPGQDSVTGGRAAHLYDASVKSLDAIVGRLEERVTALTSYRDRLRALSRELADSDTASRIDDAAARISDLASATIGETDTAEKLAGLVPKAREGTDVVPITISALRDDVSQLRDMAATQVSPQP